MVARLSFSNHQVATKANTRCTIHYALFDVAFHVILLLCVVDYLENVLSEPNWQTVPLEWGGGRVVGTSTGFFLPNSDILAKKRDLGPPKKTHLLVLAMFWPRLEKVVQRKKYRFPK